MDEQPEAASQQRLHMQPNATGKAICMKLACKGCDCSVCPPPPQCAQADSFLAKVDERTHEVADYSIIVAGLPGNATAAEVSHGMRDWIMTHGCLCPWACN